MLEGKRHLRCFNGIKPESFYWYLKEHEWRFNGGTPKILLNQPKTLGEILILNPLSYFIP